MAKQRSRCSGASMRTPEQLLEDQRRLERCAEFEALIERVAKKHPGLSLRELAAKLPARESARLLELADELSIWSQEVHAP